MEITIGLAQMAIARDRPEQNEGEAREIARRAEAQGVELLILPELWSYGYDLERAAEYAAPLEEGPFALMAELAAHHNLYLLGTALETNPGGRPYNTAALFDPAGHLSAVYRKVHLFPPMGELEHLSAGQSLPTFDLPWGRTALAVCYDLRFPEMWRAFADQGVQLVLLPAQWPLSRVEHWRLLLRARAVENQLFVAGCNRSGQDTDGLFGGHSAAVDPLGRVVVEGGSGSAPAFPFLARSPPGRLPPASARTPASPNLRPRDLPFAPHLALRLRRDAPHLERGAQAPPVASHIRLRRDAPHLERRAQAPPVASHMGGPGREPGRVWPGDAPAGRRPARPRRRSCASTPTIWTWNAASRSKPRSSTISCPRSGSLPNSVP